MPLQLGDKPKWASYDCYWALDGPRDPVIREDGTSISPQYLFDIELYHRVSATSLLRELARVLKLDYD